jgi:hypothetical protein
VQPEPILACPICGDTEVDTVFPLTLRLHNASYPTRLVKCRQCKLLRMYNRVPVSHVAQTYSENYLWDATPEDATLVSNAATWYQNDRFNLEIRQDERICHIPKGSIIVDYGTGYGARIGLLQKRGFQAVGYDPFYHPPLPVGGRFYSSQQELLTDLHDGSVEMIQFNHSLGFLHNLVGDCNALLKKLKVGGWVVVRAPNPDSIQAHIFKERWYAIDPLHLQYLFSPAHLEMFFSSRDCALHSVDYYFPLFHPPTAVLSLFPGLDPLSRESRRWSLFLKVAWVCATLCAAPLVKIEQYLQRTSVYTAYFRKSERQQ